MRDPTCDALIEAIKRRGSIPADQSTLGTTEMLAIADDELQTVLTPLVMSLRADHFLTYTDYTTTAEVTYAIPYDALNRNLRSVVYVDADGSERALTRIEFDEEAKDANFSRSNWGNGAYYVRGDFIKLYPTSEPNKTLRMHYYRVPNRLVANADAAEVLSVDYDTHVVTTSGVPAAWADGDSLCCVAGRPGFSLRFAAQDAVSVSSPTVQFADASEVQAGDWLALEGESPIPQIPLEAHPILAQASLVQIMEALGDMNGLKSSQGRYEQLMANYLKVATPRVEEQPRVLASRTGLRFGGGRSRWF